MGEAATRDPRFSDEQITSEVSNWITYKDLVRENSIFDFYLGKFNAHPEYGPAFLKGIEQGLAKAFENGAREGFRNNDCLWYKFNHLLKRMRQKPELAAGITPAIFEKLATLQIEDSRYKLDNDTFRLFVRDNPENMAVLAKVVAERINKEDSYTHYDTSTDTSTPRSATAEEREKDRHHYSVLMIKMFYDLPKVMQVIDADLLKTAVENDLTPYKVGADIQPNDILTIARALKSAPQFEAAITPDNITVAAQALYDGGNHEEAATLFENIQHIDTFRKAFMSEYTDILQIGKNITVAFNTVANPQKSEPQMAIMIGNKKYQSFEAMAEAYKDSEATMKVAWTLQRLAKGETLPEFVTEVRHESDGESLAKIAQQQIGLQPIMA